MRRERGQSRAITKDGFTVRINPTRSGWRIVYYNARKRVFERAKDEAEATARAETLLNRWCMGISPVLDLSPEDTVRFERARRFLSPWGMKIDEATMEYVQARQLLSDVSIMDAAKFYRGFFPVNNDNRNVLDLVDEFIEFKKPVCSPSYIKDLRNRLGRFAEALQCPLVMLTPAKMKAYFDSFNETSARNYNNTRGAIGTFLKYCQRREYLPGDIDLLKKLDVRKEVREEVKIFSPDE